MATYKATFIFNHSRMGWSESFYITVSTQELAMGEARALASKRTKCLGAGARIEAIRLSDVAVPRICALEALSLGFNPELPVDAVWTSWIANLCASSLYRRSFLMRGWPDAWTVWDAINGEWLDKPERTDAANNFFKALKAAPWLLRVISKDPADVQLAALGKPLVGEGGWTKFAGVFPGVEKGDYVMFSKWDGKDKKVLNGKRRVLSNELGFLTVDVLFANIIDPDNDSGGKVGRRVIKYVAISDGKLLRPAKRNTGRAFFVPRGRRFKRK